jgi:hypothetical protein
MDGLQVHSTVRIFLDSLQADRLVSGWNHDASTGYGWSRRFLLETRCHQKSQQ